MKVVKHLPSGVTEKDPITGLNRLYPVTKNSDNVEPLFKPLHVDPKYTPKSLVLNWTLNKDEGNMLGEIGEIGIFSTSYNTAYTQDYSITYPEDRSVYIPTSVLFARKVTTTPILKDIDISLKGEWVIYFLTADDFTAEQEIINSINGEI